MEARKLFRWVSHLKFLGCRCQTGCILVLRLVEQDVLLTACLPACLPACLEVPRNDACRHPSDTSSVPIRIPFDIQTRSQHDAGSVSRAKLLGCDVQ